MKSNYLVMDIRIKTDDFQMTPDVQATLDKALASIEKILSNDTGTARCEVELGRASGRHKSDYMWFAEVRIISPGGTPVYARNNASTVNAAIDDVKEEVERQLRRGKKLHIRVMRKTGSAIKNWMKFGS